MDITMPPHRTVVKHLVYNKTFNICLALLYLKRVFFFVLFKKFKLCLIDWWLLYNIGLISATHQHEVAIDVHTSPPSWTPSHLPSFPTPLGCYRALVWVPWVLEQISIGYLFHTWQCICFRAALSTHLTLSFLPLPLSISLSSMSAFPLLPCKQVHLYHLSRFHVYCIWWVLYYMWLEKLQFN